MGVLDWLTSWSTPCSLILTVFVDPLNIENTSPELETFKKLNEKGLIQLVIIPAVGCEKFAEYIYEKINPIIKEQSDDKVRIMSVEVREHESNSAIYMGDGK